MKLSHLLRPEHILLDVPVQTREEVLAYVAQHLEREGSVRSAQDLVDLLLDRERLGATVVGDETAIPHCKVPGLKSFVTAVARLPKAIAFGPDAADRARLFVFVFSPREQPAMHLQLLAAIARLLRQPQARSALTASRTGDEVLARLAKLEAAS